MYLSYTYIVSLAIATDIFVNYTQVILYHILN